VILGGYPTSFGGSTIAAAFANFNADSGSTLSLAHDYLRPGMTLTTADASLARTPGTVLLLNWKPTYNWAAAGGANASVNSDIDAMAHSIKALGSVRILVSLYHEPEKDVSGGASNCPAGIYRGSSGTPAQYRAMWANVEARFATVGVSNVVWSMNYMGYPTWNCMIDALWPGNGLVDWVMWDPYSTDKLSFSQSVDSFYRALTSRSDSANDYLSKPWGLAEFGDRDPDAADQETFYSTVAHSLDTNEFPKVRLLSVFDAIGTNGDYRVAYDESGAWDSVELADFGALDRDPVIAAGRASVAGG